MIWRQKYCLANWGAILGAFFVGTILELAWRLYAPRFVGTPYRPSYAWRPGDER